jgi:hypothetical protein
MHQRDWRPRQICGHLGVLGMRWVERVFFFDIICEDDLIQPCMTVIDVMLNNCDLSRYSPGKCHITSIAAMVRSWKRLWKVYLRPGPGTVIVILFCSKVMTQPTGRRTSQKLWFVSSTLGGSANQKSVAKWTMLWTRCNRWCTSSPEIKPNNRETCYMHSFCFLFLFFCFKPLGFRPRMDSVSSPALAAYYMPFMNIGKMCFTFFFLSCEP